MGYATRGILEEFAVPLSVGLAKLPTAKRVHAEVDAAVRALRDVLHARELGERLALHADELMVAAETDVERELRDLFKVLAKATPVRTKVFAAGLAASLAVRGEAQLREANRVLAALGKSLKLPSLAGAIIARLSQAAATLTERCAASAAAHASLLELLTAEHHARREFGTQYRAAYGALMATAPRGAQRFDKLFRRAGHSRPAIQTLPKAPPPTKKAKAR